MPQYFYSIIRNYIFSIFFANRTSWINVNVNFFDKPIPFNNNSFSLIYLERQLGENQISYFIHIFLIWVVNMLLQKHKMADARNAH